MEDDKQILEIIYYTKVNDPENVEKIEITKSDEYESINNFILRNTKRRRDPNIDKFEATGLYDLISEIISRIKVDYPSVDANDVISLFNIFTSSTHTSSKSKERYCGVIITSNFLFFYYFKPEKGITFVDNTIKDFIKHLDVSTLTRFIFLTSKENLKEYFDVDSRDQSFNEADNLVYSYEKQFTKGFQELLHSTPVYESKGEIKVRGSYNNETDLVIETHADCFFDLDDSLNINLEQEKIEISKVDLNITEFQINGKKFSAKNKNIFKNRVCYDLLEVPKIISELNFYLNRANELLIHEESDKIILKTRENEDDPYISKPHQKLCNKPTIYIVGSGKLLTKIDDKNLISIISNYLKNNSSLSLVEISRFNDKFNMVDIDDMTLFLKFDKHDELNTIINVFDEIRDNIEGDANRFYKKVLNLICLIKIKDFLHDKVIRNAIYEASRNTLTDIFSNLSQQDHSLVLKEHDEIGIEFKAGVRNDGRGFFDPSPKKFSEKLIEKTKSKRLNFIIYFIGINEDTMDFSPIPLSRARNEFIADVKENLLKQNIHVHLFETIPLDDKNGILLIILSKS